MRKKGKFGINSGNSFSFGSVRNNYALDAKNEHVIVKTYENGFIQAVDWSQQNARILKEAQQMVNDGAIDDNINYEFPNHGHYFWRSVPKDILYSMNKRKRWNLKENILDTISNLRSEDEQEGKIKFKVTLAERQICAKSSQYLRVPNGCVAYHSSHAVIPHVYPSKGASYETDLKRKAENTKYKNPKEEKKQKRKSGHNQHFRDLQRKFPTKKNNRTNYILNEDENAWLFRAHPPGRDRAGDVNDEGDDRMKLPEVHYEICSGHPLTGSKHYNDEHQVPVPGWETLGKKAFKKRKHARTKEPDHGYTELHLQRLCQTWMEEDTSLPDVEENTINNESLDRNDSQLHSNAQLIIDFSEIISYAKNNKNKNKSKRYVNQQTIPSQKLDLNLHPHIIKYGKGETIYEEQAVSNEDVVDVENNGMTCASPVVEYTPAPPICVLIDSSSITCNKLEKQYRDAYNEGYSIPRLFTVNISRYLSGNNLKVLHNNNNDKGGGINSARSCDNSNDVYLVVNVNEDIVDDTDIVKENEGEWQNVCHYQRAGITVAGNFSHLQQIGIHHRLAANLRNNENFFTIHDITDCLFDSLIKKYSHYLNGTYLDWDVCSIDKKHRSVYKYFNQNNKWMVRNYTMPQTYAIMEDKPLKFYKNRLKKLNSVTCVVNDNSEEEICEICYISSHRDMYDMNNGTALNSCKHWFCNSCWREHILQGVNNGVNFLECPAYECDSVIDSATLISLLGFKTYYKHWVHLQNHKIEASPDWKWCPFTKCGRTTHVITKFKDTVSMVPGIDNDSEATVCVHCECNHRWCYDCQQEPHWPIRCTTASTYFKLVQQKNIDGITKDKVFCVEFKKCPKCRYPINKNGGCQHMLCKCGFSFCWECLASWAAHGSTLSCPKGRVDMSTVMLDDSDNIRSAEQLFEQAVKFRKQKFGILKSDRKKLDGRINMILKPFMRTNYNGKRMRHYTDVMDAKMEENEVCVIQIKDLGLYLFTVCHILEFGYVLLSQSIPKLQRILLGELHILELQLHSLSKVLYTKKINTLSSLIAQFNGLKINSDHQMDKICSKMQKIQRLNDTKRRL